MPHMATKRSRTITPADVDAARRLQALWAERAKKIGVTQDSVAELLDGTQGLVSQYMTGRIALNYRAVLAFAQALQLSDPKLIRDDLPEQQFANKVSEPPSEYVNWAEVQAYSAAVGLSDGEEAQDYAATHGLKFRKDSLRRKGLLGADLAVLYGKGDSMEPVIQTGDAVMFNRDDRTPKHEELYVVQLPGVNHNDQISVKQAELIGNIVTFRALNPEGDHHWRRPRLMDDPRNPITVVGKVCWVGKWT